ncbi:MAG TPA: PIN domain-containing protein [Gaiellaceae bacterium]|nr:PIN domain-containing protein [Gaiellaceae bacterium]
MIAIDTSLAVAALAGWHSAHEPSRRAATGAAIPAHARLETYSVLTRLPPPHRIASDVAAGLLASWFPNAEILVPSSRLSRSMVERCHDVGVQGGAVYDALVALTASEAKRTLLTRDERAAATYRRLGIAFTLLD